MTTHTFRLTKSGELQALFHRATLDSAAAMQRARDYAAQLEAELYLARLFGDGRRKRAYHY